MQQERFAQIVACYERLRAQMQESTRQAELLFQGLLKKEGIYGKNKKQTSQKRQRALA